jgi:hypothetical protein
MSKIEVNTIEPQCGTTVTVGKCTSTVAVPGNVIKSNAVQASDGGNIVSQSGTDITLGASGDTINLASGASQSGFGRTGTVDWITTPKVTGDSPITAVTGEGYFLNTTAGTITVNLPAGAAGSIVSMADYAATWQINNVTVSADGSEKIGGSVNDATLSTQGQSVTFVYVDGTQGWVNVLDSTSNVRGKSYVTATVSGSCNTLTTIDTDYKLAKFVNPGTFCVSCSGNSAGSNTVDYLVVAGGGGGSTFGGGGAGGYRESPGTASGCYSVSPLGVSPAVALCVSATPYPIQVGGGGPGGSGNPSCGAVATSGTPSIFSSITSTGGGAGNRDIPSHLAYDGGSGGGGQNPAAPGGSGNTPAVSPAQGTDGGRGLGGSGCSAGGGGGGATVAGTNATGGAPGTAGTGGTGATSSINGTPTARAGGGGGGGDGRSPGVAGGAGGPGGGGPGANTGGPAGTAGTVNTGGGAGGAGYSSCYGVGAQGGSGIVYIRYKFQN